MTDQETKFLTELHTANEKLMNHKYAMWRAKGIPEALYKASTDPFDYAMGLKNGAVFYFEAVDLGECEVFQGWVHISNIKSYTLYGNDDWDHQTGHGIADQFNFERGMDIRLEDISWVADAPFGS